MAKMSKTKKNGVSPDQLFEKYGADTLRVGILRLGPVDQELVYSESVMTGEFKFLQRIFNTVNDHIEELKNVKRFSGNASSLTKEEKDLRRRVHSTLQDTERAFQKDFSFNTLLARLHELLRDIIRAEKISAPVLREAVDVLLFSLAPFAPHLTEELWQALGNEQTILHSEWPTFDSHALQLDEVTIVVQVNSKIKDRMSISVDLSEDEIKEKALSLDRVKSTIGDKPIKKVLVVPNKLINLIV
jgi:leucyl-tRNA synthetase